MQVRESTEASKRSFLESKGLSKEKIDEAFKLAGVASPAPTAPVPSAPAKVPQAAPLVMAQQPQAPPGILHRDSRFKISNLDFFWIFSGFFCGFLGFSGVSR